MCFCFPCSLVPSSFQPSRDRQPPSSGTTELSEVRFPVLLRAWRRRYIDQDDDKMSMNASSRERGDFWAKEERDRYQDLLPLVPSSSRRWSAFRNPRIVRVSRTFGGKDRHSKVCTVRGLRDRRIRLSVTTALQLYDLQDKLGVSQPSKVIDWLLDATKHEIDKLPPLQMPPGFGGFPLVSPELLGSSRSSLAPFFDLSSSTSTLLRHGSIDPPLPSKNTLNIVGNSEREDGISRSKYWEASDLMRAKGKEVEGREFHLEKARLIEPNVPGRFSFLPPPNLSSNYSLSLSHQQLGSQLGFMSPGDQNPFAGNIDCIASSLSLSSGVAHHSPPFMPHSFPPYNNATPHPLAFENSFQLFTSGQSFMPSLHLFGSSNSRPVMGEYIRFLRPEYKTEQPPSL